MRGGIGGDYDIQIGPSTADDIAGGILITSIRNNGRDNGEVSISGTQYGISSVHDNDANGYFIPLFNTSNATNPSTAVGLEYNFDLSAAYFPYADGWIGGLARGAAPAQGGGGGFYGLFAGARLL